MAPMKCPGCGCESFYVKDPDDQFNIFEFDLKEGTIIPRSGEEDQLSVEEETETYCERCAWHDKFKALK